jgi:curved DNA-binding protein CbpA
MKDYFAILEISPDATDTEIKKAYRILAKRYHPDVSESPNAALAFIEINEAYEFLGNAERRGIYLTQRRMRVTQTEELRRAAIYKMWVEQQQELARKRASQYANSSFDDFIQSPIYKTAMVASKAFNYIFLVVGVLMILSAPVGLYLRSRGDEGNDYTAIDVIVPMSFGILFTFGIYYFLFKLRVDQD